MRVLLDTNAWLWALNNPARLSPAVRALLEDETDNAVFVSYASVWEVSIKVSIGKLDLTEPLERFVERTQAESHFQLLPIGMAPILRLASLPLLHRDPFDRMLIAQGLLENLPIITSDSRFAPYGVEVMWATRDQPA